MTPSNEYLRTNEKRELVEALREVERVLVPEGRVVIFGLNPMSLWGLRQRRAHLYRRSLLLSRLLQ